MGLNGFNILIRTKGQLVGGGYSAGVRNIPKVRAIVRILPTSRKTRLAMESIKPRPSANKREGISMNGRNTACHLGATPYQIKTSITGTSRIRKSKTGWPRAAVTNASFGKLTLVTKGPALTKRLVHAIRQPAKSCQTPMLQSA